MVNVIRSFLSLETTAFGAGALVHSGVLMKGYEHWKAAVAESVIGFVLLAGLVATYVASRSIRRIGMASQGFGLLGVMVGLVTIAIGIGPRTMPDILFHAALLALLGTGLVLTAKTR